MESASAIFPPCECLRMKPESETSTEKLGFREIFAAEETPLLRFAHRLVGRREVAEDLVQDGFLKLHENWETVENPRAWLFRCVRNLAYNELRDRRREISDNGSIHHASEEPAADETLGRLEAMGTLRRLISCLPAEQRKLLALKYEENLKYEQISLRTGLSAGNVGYKLHHLLKNLAESLRRAGIESTDG